VKNQNDEVTVCITTFNEEENIADCVDSIIDAGFKLIRVYDGGSTDQTYATVKTNFPKVAISSTQLSLSTRRKLAIEECQTKYIFFVDADQRILRYDYEQIIARNFKSGVAGVQFLKTVPEKSRTSYWQRGFAIRNRIIQGKNPVKKVIGTPCIYSCEVLRKFNYSDRIDSAADDTTVGHLLNQNGFHFIAVDEKAIEIFRPSGLGTVRKAFWYGLGDAEFMGRTDTVKSRINHLFHVFCRNPLIYPAYSLKLAPMYLPFLMVFGFARLAGFLVGVTNSKVKLLKS
jgi:glycosyltransferase involved in cell wall biosynthesis